MPDGGYRVRCSCGAVREAEGFTLGLYVSCPACERGILVAEENFAGDDATLAPSGRWKPETVTSFQPPAGSEAARRASAAAAAFGDDEEPADPEKLVQESATPGPETAVTDFAPAPVTACARCGSPFRGDWDRHETADGPICHHCSVLATEGIPDRVQQPPAPERVPVPVPPEPEEPPERFLGFDTTSAGFKGVIMAAAVATLIMMFVVLHTDFGDSPRPGPATSQQPQEALEQKDIPAWLDALWSVARVLGRFATPALTIYATLWRGGRLPNETFRNNAIVIGSVVLLCVAIQSVPALIGIHSDPADIFDFAMFFGFVAGIAAIVVVYKAFDWRLMDLFWLTIFGTIVSQLVLLTQILVLGAIGTLFT